MIIKRLMYRIRFTFLLLLYVIYLNAQIQYRGKPYKLSCPGLKNIPVIDLTLKETVKAIKPDKESKPSRLKPDEFAYTIEVDYDYSNCGVWDTLNNGTKLWRLGIYSEGAHSINLIFGEYHIANGVKVFIYDSSQVHILGALTSRNNKAGGILATTPVPCDFIYIEMQVPSFIDNPGQLKIERAGIGYEDIAGDARLKDEWYGTSGSCNVDINCIENQEILKNKHSVVRIIYLGTERCTGTLINNTSNNGRPLVLTAQHCLKTDFMANTAIFYFGYESPYCDGPDGNTLKSVSGSSLIATTDNNLDFSLVELSAEPPFNYRPYYAGWDNLDVPPENSYSIHHPMGDVKKITVDDDQATTGNYGEGYDLYTHWLISDWEMGTTEKGSSGAPLFNQNGRLVGTLTGGDADCELSVNDYYQKLYNSWDDYLNNDQQLKFWLDPSNSGAVDIEGFDPYEALWQSGDTISNLKTGETPILVRGDMDWGYLSGHNSDSIRLFAEEFNIPGQKNLFGVFLNVAKLNYSSENSNVNIIVWDGSTETSRKVAEKEVLMVNMVPDELNFIEFDSVIGVYSRFYVGCQLNYDNPLDTFALYMSENNGSNTAFISADDHWMSLYEYTSGTVSASFDIRPLIFDSIEAPFKYDTTLSTGDIKIIPVMSENVVKIELYEWPEEEVIVNIYSLNGQLMAAKSYKYADKIIKHNVSNLKNGIYLVQVLYKRFMNSEKVPVIR
jgi:lysyl endopeptidase